MINIEWLNKDLSKENLNKYKKEILNRIEEINLNDCDISFKLKCKNYDTNFMCGKFIDFSNEITKYNLLCVLTNNLDTISELDFKCNNKLCLNEKINNEN